jgi:hypothetical protein
MKHSSKCSASHMYNVCLTSILASVVPAVLLKHNWHCSGNVYFVCPVAQHLLYPIAVNKQATLCNTTHVDLDRQREESGQWATAMVECLVTDHWVILAIPHHVFCTICIHNLRWMDRMAIDSLYMYTNIPHVMHINNNTSSIASLQIHVHVHNVTLRMPVVAN